MAKTEPEYREDIVQIGRLVFQKGWVAANDGNITMRLDDDRILATPTGVSKGMMHPDDLIVVDRKGDKISGDAERTSEIGMHLAIYDLRPDVRAVVHMHPPVATGFACAGRPLNRAVLAEAVVGFGCVPLAEFGLPGTPELAQSLLALIPRYDAVLMSNHGAVCYGEDLFQAYFRMETVEHLAQVTLVAELLGGPKLLPRREVNRLIDSRGRYGVKTRSGGEPGCPLAAEDAGPDSQATYHVTRAELIGLVDAALKLRGTAR